MNNEKGFGSIEILIVVVLIFVVGVIWEGWIEGVNEYQSAKDINNRIPNTNNNTTSAAKTFTASFDPNGASSIGSTTLSCKGETSCTVIAPTITRDGFNIIGWSLTDESNTIIKVGEEITLTSNTTYYAITESE